MQRLLIVLAVLGLAGTLLFFADTFVQAILCGPPFHCAVLD